MATDAHPARRTLRLPETGTDYMTGDDIPPLQREAGQRLVEHGEHDDIGPHDGIYGTSSASGVSRAVWLCGGAKTTVVASQVKNGGKVSVRTQNFIRHPDTRPKTWLGREKARAAMLKRQRKVREPEVVITADVRNQSARSEQPRLIVLHSTESSNQSGTTDLGAIVSWFDNPSAQASAHIVIDADGLTARCVPDDRKAWSCVSYNSMSLNIEQIGYASQTSWPDKQIQETAKWVAWWAKKYNIPLEHSISRGVCQHVDLGAAGGGHHDCGPGYPEDKVLRLARRYAKRGW